MHPFTVQMGPTWSGLTAITKAMYPEGEIAELNKRLSAASSAVPGISLRPAAQAPHPCTRGTKD
jgi:hypothetical protein